MADVSIAGVAGMTVAMIVVYFITQKLWPPKPPSAVTA